MRKFIVLFLFFLPLFACPAVEMQTETSVSYDVNYKRRKKTPEKAVITSVNRIYCGSLLAEYSIFTLSACISSAVFTYATDYVFAPILFGLTTCGLFFTGISLIASGYSGYHKAFVRTCDLRQRFERKISIFEASAIIFGFVFGFGVLFTAGGITVLVSNINLMNKKELFITGGFMTGIGGTFCLSALPVMITSLAMSAWLKGQTNRLSVDIGITSGSTGELSGDKRRNVFEKPNGVALALSVKF